MNREVARLIYTGIQSLRGKPVVSQLRFLERAEKYSSAALTGLQWKRLKRMLAFCSENVPYYKELFDRTGVDVQEIRECDDFRSIPMLTKELVRENSEKLLPRRPLNRIYFEYTSGSTGRPLKLGRDHDSSGAFWAAMYRGLRWHGIDVGDPGAVIWSVASGRKRYRKQKIDDFFLNRIRLGVLDMTEESAENFFQRCLRFRPTYIYGFPSGISQFVEILGSKGQDGGLLKLKVIIATGEVLYPFQKERIEGFFKTRVINEYGSSEFGNCAFECPQGGMHITSENVYLEINRNSAIGHEPSTGEAVVTGLVNHAMPLIRYNLGDIIELSGEKCSCGRGLPLLRLVEGRKVAFAKDCSGNLVNGRAFLNLMSDLFREGGDVKQFKFIQKEDYLIVAQVVRGPFYDNSSTRAIDQGVKRILGPSVSTRIDFVDHIPRDPSGKLSFFVSEILEGNGW